MARRFGRFEVKNEMTDGGKIRHDDTYKQNGGKTSSEQQKEIIEDANQVGFDDFDFEFEQDDIDFEERIKPEIEEKEVGLDDEEIEIDENIKSKVNNYEFCSKDEIEEILNFIADRKRQELGIDFEFEAFCYGEGGVTRTENGQQQVEIGYKNLSDMKDNKEMKRLAELGKIDIGDEISEVSPTEERKEFIEVILATYHELGHVKQNHNIQDNPILNEENRKMTRERVIEYSFDGFRSRFNYEQSMQEIDAMRTSLEETVKFFQEMGTDITPDEVFAVMKEKELSAYLDYDLRDFGDSYETAMSYFNQIYGKTTEIKGIPDIIKSLPDDKKEILYSQCQDLLDSYYAETDMDKKMELLKEMSLRMTPELREEYPLADIQTERSEETGFILKTINGKKIEEMQQEPKQETGFVLTSVNGKSVEELMASYQNAGINKSDLSAARNMLAKTKEEREQDVTQVQTQPNKDESEGR